MFPPYHTCSISKEVQEEEGRPWRRTRRGGGFNFNKAPGSGWRRGGILNPPALWIDLVIIGVIVWDLTDGFERNADLVSGGGAEALDVIERNLVVAALLRGVIWQLFLVADSSPHNDCDDETVVRAAYLYYWLYLEEGYVSDAVHWLLLEEAED